MPSFDEGVGVAVAVEVGEARHAVQPHSDAVERIGGAGLLGEGRREGGEAGGVGDLELEAAARGRCVRGIAVGEVFDQRLDPRRRRRRVEGDGERAAGAAGEAADESAAEGDVAAGDADLARAGALVADRHRVLRQQARDRQRAGVKVVVGVGEVTSASMICGAALTVFSRNVTRVVRPVSVGTEFAIG